MPQVLVFHLEIYYKVTGLTAQQKGTTAWWYLNKTALIVFNNCKRFRKEWM